MRVLRKIGKKKGLRIRKRIPAGHNEEREFGEFDTHGTLKVRRAERNIK